MLPSFVANLIWGFPPEEESGSVSLDHSTSEEPGDWLLISCGESEDPDSISNRLTSECDSDSVSSESSWVITPATPFRASSQSSEMVHPLEDLLIEHPTMSVYHHVVTNTAHVGGSKQSPETGAEWPGQQCQGQTRNRNVPTHRQLVLLRNRQRQQVATQLQLPLTVPAKPRAVLVAHPPKLTRRAMRRQNINLIRGKQTHRLQNYTFRAGRRRC